MVSSFFDNNFVYVTGADIDAEDDYGDTSLSIAERFGFKSCGRHLFLFHWQQRAKKVTPARSIPLMPHQKNDSLYPVWKRGQKVSGDVTGSHFDICLYFVHFRKGHVSQTNIGSVSKTTLEKLLRDGVEHIWAVLSI